VSVDLYRVDERLIHGQVVLGWGGQLATRRYIVVDDELAGSGWEQDLYRLGAGGAELVFVTLSEALGALTGWQVDGVASILLTRDVRTMRLLSESGDMDGCAVNIGGLHHAPGRVRVLDYVYLSPRDDEDLRVLADQGVTVSARDLPDMHPTSLATLLDRRR